MPVLLYIHWFNSSDRSHKATVLMDAAAKMGQPNAVLSPCLSWQPAKAIAQLEAMIEKNLSQGVTLIGSSLGGFYAAFLAEKYHLNTVLVNPAVQAPTLLTRHLGHQQNPYTNEAYELTGAHMLELENLVIAQPTPKRYWLMVQEGDEVLDYRAALTAFPQVARLTQEAGGDHRFVDFERFTGDILRFAQIITD
ncbi:YqiA/YcfP family alpha/beta fold hydrolase [Marinomonas sp. IMCC 4694]|uniref:YqiA/YcfP family alpha/beta fold hydrolase n=1 Tax=Marinomonas sp. IMCC 4694 TaxID=2605432 RepID=UPI0011E821E7|nr:YqiA/YcfP family alpha/beta fold hydrolase [Marinomonas sp. IMCC 4694]TYL47160.1 hypothetical protein FXV75_03910 [Marinomonas sp. IMCC 4694]